MAAWHTDPNAPLPRWERCCFWLADDTSEAVLASDVFEAGAPQQNLAGAATGAAQASGALDHGVSLGGAASAAGGAAAGLAVSVPLAVSAAAAAFTAAQLAIAKAMGGAATGQGSAAAGLLLAKALAAVAGGQAQALGDLGLAKLLAAAAGAQGLATGDLQAGAVGTITFTADHELRNNLGTVWASQSGITVHVYTAAGAHVVTKTGHTTDASGIPAPIADAALTAGTPYRCVIRLASGADGMSTLMAG